jgi:hypothetical protein
MEGSGSGEAPGRAERGWPRAVALLLLAWAFPVSRANILIAVAYLVMLVGLPVRRRGAWVIGAIMVWAVLSGDHEGLWWTERGWALLVGGWFVALTIGRPGTGFLPRALSSVAGAAAVAAALVVVRGGLWNVLDWQVSERMHAYLSSVMEGMRQLQQPGSLSPVVVTAMNGMAETQIQVFPATAALASIAALGVAWWLYLRVAQGDDQGLLPLREFRFNDHLVWLFVGGLALVLVGGEGLDRAGSNAVVFMSGLYALRGAAVVMFLGAGQSLLSVFFLVLALLFIWPVVAIGALVIGLGDTWLDLRARARAMTA